MACLRDRRAHRHVASREIWLTKRRHRRDRVRRVVRDQRRPPADGKVGSGVAAPGNAAGTLTMNELRITALGDYNLHDAGVGLDLQQLPWSRARWRDDLHSSLLICEEVARDLVSSCSS